LRLIKHYILKLLFIFFTFCLPLLGHAQKLEKWTNYTVDDGLIDNFVECFLEDNRGFLWVGTWSGISRFDGKVFVNFRKGLSDSTSMPGNWVHCIYQDRSDRIWVGTDEGLAMYNFNKNRIETVKTIGRHAVISVKEDLFGNVWVAGDNFLYQLNATTLTLMNNKSFQNDLFSKPFEIGEICFDSKNNLWVSTSNQGILFFESLAKSIQLNEPASQKRLTFTRDHINSMQLEGDSTIWVGTMHDGLYRIELADSLKSKHFLNEKNNAASLADNRVVAIFQDKGRNWWVVNSTGVLNKFLPESKQFERVQVGGSIIQSNEQISSSCFYIDRNGNEWIGTHGNGVLHRNRQKEKFANFANSKSQDGGNKIASFLTLSSGKLLVGTDGGGLSLFDPDTHSYSSLDIGTRFRTSKVLDIELGNYGEIWISFWGNGIASLDAESLKLKKHIDGRSNDNALLNNDVKSILVDGDVLWMVSSGDGIFQYDIKSSKFIERRNTNTPFDFTIPKWGNNICKDSKGRYWISSSKGLFLFDGKKLIQFVRNEKKLNSLISNLVLEVFEDSRKNIWVVTDMGLDLYQDSDSSFMHFGNMYGLPNQLKSMQEDRHHRLWLSSNQGITCFDPTNNKVFNYSMENGLPSGVFYHGASEATKDGELVFGSLNGFTFFNPDSIAVFREILPPVFTDFQINYISNLNLLNDRHIQSAENIELNYSSEVITFKFISVDLTNSQRIRYSYWLKNHGSDWVDLGEQNFVSFTNLPPGDYELNVLAKNDNGATSSESLKLQLRILPPWYWSNWAIFLYLVAVLLLLYGLYYFLTFRFKLQNKINLQRFEHHKKLELYQSKIDFFTSISHDIRTPLTLIMAPIELLRLKIAGNTEALKMLSIMEKNANELLSLTNELLEFKSLESGERKLHFETVDFKELMSQVIEGYQNEAVVRNMELTSRISDCTLSVDVSLMKKLLNNVLINAFKFAPDGGKVEVTLEAENTEAKITVYNNGSSITDEMKKKIFDPFFTSRQEKGYGLGLAIVKEIASKHKGLVWVENVKEGVQFTISIQKG
jgi:signal transduction histidine kinase/sugar lactone lactonase YvrE